MHIRQREERDYFLKFFKLVAYTHIRQGIVTEYTYKNEYTYKAERSKMILLTGKKDEKKNQVSR